MVRLPRSMESAATAAATRHEVVSAASSSTGMNAIHVKGHTTVYKGREEVAADSVTLK